MRTCQSIAFVLLLLFLGPSACSQSGSDLADKRTYKVDEIFAEFNKSESPGCSVGVISNGEFIYKRAYGLASLELGVPLTSASVFYVGSLSKQFTAASVVLAAERGYLSLDDDVRKWVPEMPDYGHTITLRHMLHHTSGIRDLFSLFAAAGKNPEDIHPLAEIIDLIAQQKHLNFNPGDEYQYSNSNYILLAQAVHRATGKPLSQFAQENIFGPLGMTHTRFYDDHTVVVPGRVPAYSPLPTGGFQVDWSTNFEKVGDGGLMTSVDDLLLWDRNFYSNKLGKGTLLSELQTHGRLNNGKEISYALGLVIAKYRNLPAVAHSGALFGYRSELLRFPEQKFSVICLCNVGTANTIAESERVTDIYLNGQFPEEPAARALAPSAKAAAQAQNTNLREFAGIYRDAGERSFVKVAEVEGELRIAQYVLKPVGVGVFSGLNGAEARFEKTPGGGMRLTFSSTDEPSRAMERLEAIKLTPEELTDYEGAYYSDELLTTYKLHTQGGQLTLILEWNQPKKLEATIKDEFRGAGVLAFRRKDGKITGFSLFATGLRDIWFQKK